MFYKVKVLILLLFLCRVTAFAGGKFSGICNWMDISPSPRAAGVGVAFYGIARGANASLFNPAALGLMEEREIKLHYGLMLAESTYSSLAYVEPVVNVGVFSFIGQYYSTGKMQEIRKGILGDTFTNYDIAVNLGYGYSVLECFALGLNVKSISSKLFRESAMGYGVDFGASCLVTENTMCGLSVQNISAPVKYRDTSETLTFAVAGGISHTLRLAAEEVALTFAIGAKYMGSDNFNAGIGIEHTVYNQFSLRAGYQYDSIERNLKFPANLTAGIGINISGIIIDYAWVPYGEMGYSHRIGLGHRFSSGIIAASKNNVSIEAYPSIFAPYEDNLKIDFNWNKLKNVGKWKIEIINSYGIAVRTIVGEKMDPYAFWDGNEDSGQVVLDGNYTIKASAETRQGWPIKGNVVEIVVDAILPEINMEYSELIFSPNEDGINDKLEISVNCNDNYIFDEYKIGIYNKEDDKIKEFSGIELSCVIVWDGKDDRNGKVVESGDYFFIANARDVAGNMTTLSKETITVNAIHRIKTKKVRIIKGEFGKKIILESKKLFNGNEIKLKKESYEILNEVVDVLNVYKKNKISIEGHTDNVGSEYFNYKLSKDRAEAVNSYIMGKGVEERRVTVKAWGEKNPIVSNKSRLGRYENSRIEIIVKDLK